MMEMCLSVFLACSGLGVMMLGAAFLWWCWIEVRSTRDTHSEQMFAIALDAFCRLTDEDKDDKIE